MDEFPPQVEDIFKIKNHALLFGIFCSHIQESNFSQPIKLIQQIVRQYALERGQRMALRTLKFQEELTMENFLVFGEWIPDSNIMQQQDYVLSPVYISHVTQCPWAAYWKSHEFLEYGKQYCDIIDKTLIEGYNPDLYLIVKGNLTKGDAFCEFHWNGVDLTQENQMKLNQKKESLGMLGKKSWEYHTAHLYWTFRKKLEQQDITKIKKLINLVNQEYSEIFGEKSLFRLMNYERIDFSSIEYENTKIFILGFGNLMQSLFPYIETTVGADRKSERIIATTADPSNLEENIQKFCIPIYYKDNINQLSQLEPNIIFFAPPPSKALEIINDVLKPYYSQRRTKKSTLPALYAFPPIPNIEYYQKILGSDIPIVTILPNDVREIHGIQVIGEGAHFCTFSSFWPMKEYELFIHIFGQSGHILALETSEVLPLLITRVLTSAFLRLFQYIIEGFQEFQMKMNLNQEKIAEQLRKHLHYEITSKSPRTRNVDAKYSLEDNFDSFLQKVIFDWLRGIQEYCIDIQLNWTRYHSVVEQMLDLILRRCSKEPIHQISENISIAATKGGLLELAILSINNTIIPNIKNHIENVKNGSKVAISLDIKEEIQGICHLVLEHGKNLLN
ncbi:MAG: L-2-amino-thiazoline-4-carboxylic acid hydrolase [Promethearchaeota archaeon]